MYDWTLVKNESLQEMLNGGMTLMQYTGLKDKNGKEIYEGDIVSAGGEIATVEYMRIKEAKFEASADGAGDLLGFTETDIDIIGNIYENPELLNKSNTQ
ncbi:MULTISPECIES: YopX family protein [Alphaproteobacteria]|uniref:YopX family protein n=1 Tax=Alphaproteobacteria TaxID=28211 RepID=UPI0032670F42